MYIAEIFALCAAVCIAMSGMLVSELQGRMPLVLTIHRAADILAALKLARQHGIRLIIQGAAEGWLVADELAQQKVPVILNPEQMIKEDPIAKKLLMEFNGSPMANQNLTQDEARQVLEYFRTL